MTKKVEKVGQLKGFIFLSSSLIALLSFSPCLFPASLLMSFPCIYFPAGPIFSFLHRGSSGNPVLGFKQQHQPSSDLAAQSLWKNWLLRAGSLLSWWFYFSSEIYQHLDPISLASSLSSLATAVLIVVARILHERLPDRKEPAVLGFISNISYSVYLFHWPFYIVFNQLFGNLVAVVLTLIFIWSFDPFSFYVWSLICLARMENSLATLSLKPMENGWRNLIAFDHFWYRPLCSVARLWNGPSHQGNQPSWYMDAQTMTFAEKERLLPLKSRRCHHYWRFRDR